MGNLITLALVAAQIPSVVIGVATDPDQCTISYNASGRAGVANTVTVTAVGIDGVVKTTGDDTFTLRVEQECTPVDASTCTPVSSSTAQTLPQDIPMTFDSAIGKYTADYTIDSGFGDLSISAILQTQASGGGLYAEYWTNTSWSGTPTITQQEGNIDYNWASGYVTPLSQGDNVSARWTGTLIAPLTDTYTFTAICNDEGTLVVGSNTVNCERQTNGVMSASLNAGAAYAFSFKFFETQITAWARVHWSYTGVSTIAVPASSFATLSRIDSNSVYAVTIGATSVPSQSTLETTSLSTVITAGDSLVTTFQSRDSIGTPHTVSTDSYSVVLTPTTGSALTDTAVHQSAGSYTATFNPTVAGTYTLTATMTNDLSTSGAVANSPQTITVEPGPISAPQCSSNAPTLTTPQSAGSAIGITVSFADQYGNVVDDLTGGVTVDAIATYDNHNDWSSPIGVPDDPNWVTTYGTTHAVTDFTEVSGTMAGTLNIVRAGDYKLDITVDSGVIQGSPHLYLKIKPDDLNGANCVLADNAPTEMYAGFDYWFQIQGRDLYQNNVKDLLTSVFGINSVQFDLVSPDLTHSIAATVIDDPTAGYQGVYRVDVSLAKSEPDGTYSVDIQLNGSSVTPAPIIQVLPCSNFAAIDLGMISELDSGLVALDDVEYMIGDELVAVELTPIDFFCEHTPTQTVLSAQVSQTSTGSGNTDLSTEQLALHGISIDLSSGAPLLGIQTIDESFGDLTFDIQISSTLVEEPAWQRIQSIKIYYLAIPVIPVVEVDTELVFVVPDQQEVDKEKPIEFDADSTNSKTLQMEWSEDTQMNYFKPIILTCDMKTWERSLPAIVDEDPARLFAVSISLGQADKLLSYSSGKRKFKLLPQMTEVGEFSATITIQITSFTGKKTSYEQKVLYTCFKGLAEEYKNKVLEFTQIDEDPPLPKIYSISEYGEVVVRFSHTMMPKVVLNETEQGSEAVQSRRLAFSQPKSHLGEILGSPVPDSKNFTLLHNNSVVINETVYPVLQVSIRPEDPQDPCAEKLQFTWETLYYTERDWSFKLNFENPACVSASSYTGDTVAVTFYDQRLFMDTRGKLIPPEITIKKNIRRQMAMEDEALLDAVTSGAKAMMAGSLFTIVLNLFLQTSISQMIGAVRNLQVIVHIMLIQLYLVPHAASFLKEIQKMISFEIYDPGDISQEYFDVTESESIDINFESVGYETSDFILNLGIPFFAIMFAPAALLLLYLLSKCTCCKRLSQWSKRKLDGFLFNGIIVFIDGSYLILTVCCLVQIFQVQKGIAAVTSSYYGALGFVVGSAVYAIVLLLYLNKKFDNLSRSSLRQRVGSAYEGYSLRKAGRLVLVAVGLSYARRLALGFIVTYGRNSTEAQRIYMNFGTQFMIVFIGYVQPHELPSANRLEFFNEATILVLYSHCIAQTDFVTHIEGRYVTGWSMICVISLNILVNLGSIIIKTISDAYLRLKYRCIRRRRMKELIKKQEEQRKALQEIAQVRNKANLDQEKQMIEMKAKANNQLKVEDISDQNVSYDLNKEIKPIRNHQNIPLKVNNKAPVRIPVRHIAQKSKKPSRPQQTESKLIQVKTQLKGNTDIKKALMTPIQEESKDSLHDFQNSTKALFSQYYQQALAEGRQQ